MARMGPSLQDRRAAPCGACFQRTAPSASHRPLQVVMDAALANCVCGWLPPFRPKMLRTLKDPNYSEAACTHPGCRIKNCKGNRSRWDGDDLLFE